MDAPPILSLLFKLSPLWLCFGCGYLFFRELAARNWIGKDRRISWAFTVLLMGVLYVVIGESAGAMRRLTRGTVLTMWLAADAALLAAVVRMRRPTREAIIAGVQERWRRVWTLVNTKSSASRWNAAMFLLVSATVLLVGAIALECPTTSWDSLTYHVPRIMHWLQQRSLSPYPTNLPRQLESAPGAELQTSAMMLLTGDDWALNMPQWWALLTCAVLASFLAERLLTWHLGKKPLDMTRVRWCGLLAALIAVTIPAGVTQAITSMNDLLSAQWLTLLAVFGLLVMQEPKNCFYGAGVAAALALGVNNKPLMFLYAPPFVAAIGFWLLRKSFWRLVALGVAAAVFALAVNLPWMARNYEVFHHPLGSQETRRDQPLRDHAPAKIAANVVRNVALYAGTPFDGSTSSLNHLLRSLFGVLGEPPQDEGSVWLNQTFEFAGKSVVTRGDGLGGFLVLMPPLLAMLFFPAKFKGNSPLVIYPGLLVAGFALFCGYLRWQPWHPRFHLPFLILAAAFAGMVLGWVWNRWLALAASLLLVANALLVLGYNADYPVLLLSKEPPKTREESCFYERPELAAGMAELGRDIVSSGVSNVLLKITPDTWEYPFWVCLKNRGFHGTIQHVLVDNESARLGAPDLDLPGTAILGLEDVDLPPLEDFGLRVGYDRWAAYYRGKPERRVKLISNQVSAHLNFHQSGILSIRCRPIDQRGLPVTNNVLRLQMTDSSLPPVSSQRTGATVLNVHAVQWSRDYPITSEQMEFEPPFKPGTDSLRITCLNPLSASQRIMTLANWETKVTFTPP